MPMRKTANGLGNVLVFFAFPGLGRGGGRVCEIAHRWSIGVYRRLIADMADSSGVNRRFDIHAWPKLAVTVFAWIDHDLYGNALNDFYVVAGCVFRWQ